MREDPQSHGQDRADGLTKYSHRKAKLHRNLAWFDRSILGTREAILTVGFPARSLLETTMNQPPTRADVPPGTVPPEPAASIPSSVSPPHDPFPSTRIDALAPSPAPEEGPPLGVPERVGRFLLKGEVGRGGMGVVYRAHDPDLRRTVAVKVMQEKFSGDPSAERRFLEEAQLVGQLQHPGIPPVHERGRLGDGRPFFAMKLIQGRTLGDLLRERPSPSDELPRFLDVFRQVCETLAYAHARGVLHRDLKPGNVMVGAFGEVQVLDWGLGKVRPDAAGETSGAITTVRTEAPGLSSQAGSVLGTPAYMAPEQARGEVERLDERTDVFGLGAILCVILTAQPPYAPAGDEPVSRQAARGDLTGAFTRLHGCGAGPELIRLAKACLAPERGERPRDAGEVARAVAAYQAGMQEKLQAAERERAVAEARAEEEARTRQLAQTKAAVERWARRLTLYLAGAALLLVTAGGGAALWYQHDRATQEAEEAHRERERAGRVATAETAIEQALGEATTQADLALTRTNRPESWRATLAAALSASRRAVALAEREKGLISPALARRVREVSARVEAEEKERKLLERFDALRIEQSEIDPASRAFKLDDIYPKLKQALADYGLPVGGVPAARAAARIRQRPEAVRNALIAVLDMCATTGPRLALKQQFWLAAVLVRADDDPWRARARLALALGNRDLLARMLKEDGPARQPPSFLVSVAWALQDQNEKAVIGMLRQLRERAPDDFWVNYVLAQALHRSVPTPELMAAPATKGRESGEWLSPLLPPGRERPFATDLAALRERVAGGDRGQPSPDKVARLDEAQRYYTVARALRPTSPGPLVNMGRTLLARGDREGAVAALEQAAKLAPEDAAVHNNLGVLRAEKGDFEGAVAALRRAVALDPASPGHHADLGMALQMNGDAAGAVAALRKALELEPRFAGAYHNLGSTLWIQGDRAGAVAAYRKALDLEPGSEAGWTQLGHMLREGRDLKGALAAYKKAVELAPALVAARLNLGNALWMSGDRAGARAVFKRAIELDPRDVWPCLALGSLLRDERDFPGAVAVFRQGVVRSPRNATVRTALGNALQMKGDLEEAIACYRKAIETDPRYAQAHYSLGHALDSKQDLAGAEAAYRKAVELRPDFAEAHCNLGQVLKQQGRFGPALASLKKGQALGSKRPVWPYPSAVWIRECERMLALEEKLPAVLKGEARPGGALEQLALAEMCLRFKKRYATAARLYGDAFAGRPALANNLLAGSRYNAACAATLAAAGRGTDPGRLDSWERICLRAQALDWLRGDLTAWARLLKETPAVAGIARRTLSHWHKDPDLAPVRGKDALAELGRDEREGWQRLWHDADALLKKAGGR